MTRVRSKSDNMDETVQQEIERYRQRKQAFDEMLALRQEESYRVQSLPPQEPAKPRKRHVILWQVAHYAYGFALRIVRGTRLEAGFKRTRLYQSLANRGVIMHLSTGRDGEGRA